MAYNNTHNTTNLPGTTYGTTPASGPAPHTAGHHQHDALNKLDPSVDSTRDHAPVHSGGAANGPHSSRLANKLDPTVDTKAYEAAHLGTAQASPAYQQAGARTHHGVTTGEAREGTYGPHSSRVANAADPRVDSDRDGRGAAMHGGAGYGHQGGGVGSSAVGYGNASGVPAGGIAHTAGGLGTASHHQQHGVGAAGVGHGHAAAGSMLPGPAPNTAGPHKSDILNKLDPSVDSKGGMTTERGQRRI